MSIHDGTSKFRIVDLIRSAAIMTVMALHLKPTLYLSKELWFRFAWDRFQRNGTYGVIIFFVVSGFLITRVIASSPPGLLRPSFVRFYSQRIGRIFPLYFVSIALGTAGYFLLNDFSPKFKYCYDLSGVIFFPAFWLSLFTFLYNDWHFLLAPSLSMGAHFLVYWSLSVEEQFYAIYPFALSRLKTRSSLLKALISVALVGLIWRVGVYLIRPGNLELSTRVSFGAFDAIAIGAIFYLIYERCGSWLRNHRGWCQFICVTGLLLCIVVYFCTFSAEALQQVYAPTLLALGVGGLLVGGHYLEILESKIFYLAALPGKYCYGNYLFHMSILFFFHSIFLKLHTSLAFFLFVFITTFFAAFSYHFFEMPINHWIRRYFGGEGKG